MCERSLSLIVWTKVDAAPLSPAPYWLSLTFQDDALEGYRAFTIGALGVADSSGDSIPEPSSMALLITGLGGIAWIRGRP